MYYYFSPSEEQDRSPKLEIFLVISKAENIKSPHSIHSADWLQSRDKSHRSIVDGGGRENDTHGILLLKLIWSSRDHGHNNHLQYNISNLERSWRPPQFYGDVAPSEEVTGTNDAEQEALLHRRA